MDERSLIYDWNTVEYDFKRQASNHPHGVWFDDETLRDGLQSPSARNPTIEQKIELLGYMEQLGIQKVDLGFPERDHFHRNHIDAMLTHISENDYSSGPVPPFVPSWATLSHLVEMQAKHEMEIQASAFLGTSPIRQYTEGWTMEKLGPTMEKAVSYAVENDVPVMFVTEDTTRSNPEDVKMIYQRAMELGVRRLCVCDTCGHVTPNGVKKLLCLHR
jgi:2-isopropylmalate synthase